MSKNQGDWTDSKGYDDGAKNNDKCPGRKSTKKLNLIGVTVSRVTKLVSLVVPIQSRRNLADERLSCHLGRVPTAAFDVNTGATTTTTPSAAKLIKRKTIQ